MSFKIKTAVKNNAPFRIVAWSPGWFQVFSSFCPDFFVFSYAVQICFTAKTKKTNLSSCVVKRSCFETKQCSNAAGTVRASQSARPFAGARRRVHESQLSVSANAASCATDVSGVWAARIAAGGAL